VIRNVPGQGRQHGVAGGLLIRVARALNKLWQRRGKVFADRYHDHVLRSPREVRNAVRYVLGNARKHAAGSAAAGSAAAGGVASAPHAVDTYTSAPWFDGYREPVHWRGLEHVPRPTNDAHTWLLRTGWRRHGLLSVTEAPKSA